MGNKMSKQNNMKNVIKLFDSFLFARNQKFEAIVIGGAALNIMDVIERTTKDIDFLDPNIPEEIKELSIQFANENPTLNLNPNHWINNGPRTLIRDLPQNWRNNLQKIFDGKALTLWTLGRHDLLRTKLYACADRDIDYQDCIALAPTSSELDICKEWVLLGDANPLWKNRVEDLYIKLKKDLGHE